MTQIYEHYQHCQVNGLKMSAQGFRQSILLCRMLPRLQKAEIGLTFFRKGREADPGITLNLHMPTQKSRHSFNRIYPHYLGEPESARVKPYHQAALA